MIGVGLYKAGMAELSQHIIGLAFVYDMVATFILVLVMGWLAIARPWETKEKQE
jgi:hypothetical protein